MKFPNVIGLSKEQKVRSNIDLSSCHLTTMDFGQTNLSLALQVVPTDKIDIDISQYVQLAPMVVPTVGDAKLYSRAFFVPYRFVWRYWEDFFSQRNVSDNGATVNSQVPSFAAHSLSLYFFGDLYNSQTVGYTDFHGFWTITNSNTFDFKVFVDLGNGSNARVKVVLTNKGSQILQIIQGLGYNLIPYLGERTLDSSGAASYTISNWVKDVNYSFLPLWCLGKVYCDFYANPNFNLTTITALFNSDVITGGVLYPGVGGLPDHSFQTPGSNDILEFIRYCWYDNDAFTAAWANPEVSGLSNIYKNHNVTPTPYDVDLFGDSVSSASNSGGSPSVTQLASTEQGGYTYISQIGLNVLKQMRNFVIRQSAAGGRYIDQLLARYGIRLDSNEARRSQYLGYSVADLKISRVNATAAGTDGTNASALGDFVGRGEMAGGNHIHFENSNNDFGMLFVISHIVPDTHYYQGDLPHTMQLNFFDFFNGDLENVSNAPIPYRYLFNDFNDLDGLNSTELSTCFKGIFGFSSNYLGNKIPFDRLTGDFRLTSRNTELDSFHMFRKLSNPASALDNHAVLSSSFMRYNDKNIESYEKIFNDQSNWSCHFITYFRFKINANRPMNSVMTSLVAQLNEHGNDVGDVVKVRPNGKYF